MKQSKIITGAILACVSVGLIISCSKNDGGSSNPTGGGSNTDSSLSVTGNLLFKSYQNLDGAVNALNTAVTDFNTTPTQAKLTSLRQLYLQADASWAACSEFEFGPASTNLLTTATINVFPTDTALINNNVSAGGYNINAIGNVAAVGFPAIDFLLYRADTANALSYFTTNANAAKYKQYLSDVVKALLTKTDAVAKAWDPSGGNYLQTFVKATGVDAGSSLSVLVNAYVQDYDVTLKNYKIGIPIGSYGATTLPQSPNKVEDFYSGASVAIMIKQIQAMQNIYNTCFSAKVIASGVKQGSMSLNDAITGQFNTAITKLQAINGSLSGAITNNIQPVDDAYAAITQQVVFLKVDMSSALGVKISFQDDDGD